MVNPMLQQLNNQSSVVPTQMSAPNPMQMFQQFQQFRQQMQGKDPRQMVNELIQSGKMSQDQLSQLEGQAKSIISMFGR